MRTFSKDDLWNFAENCPEDKVASNRAVLIAMAEKFTESYADSIIKEAVNGDVYYSDVHVSSYIGTSGPLFDMQLSEGGYDAMCERALSLAILCGIEMRNHARVENPDNNELTWMLEAFWIYIRTLAIHGAKDKFGGDTKKLLAWSEKLIMAIAADVDAMWRQ